MASKAPPPTRLTEKNMKRSKEMFALINALPPSAEKDAILLHEQYGEWAYHVQECRVKTYTHKPTQEEKVAGETVNEKGEKVKLFKKGQWCHHCKCSAQEFNRHRKTKKCIENRLKNEPHLQDIRKGTPLRKVVLPTREEKEWWQENTPRPCPPSPEVKEEKKKPKKLKITKKPTLSKEEKEKKAKLASNKKTCEKNLKLINEEKAKSEAWKKQKKTKDEKEKQTKKLIKQLEKYGAKKGDHYKILGLKKTATQKDIKTNYRNLAVILHPDRCKLEGSQEAIRKINKAYELLKDETTRALYDEAGMELDAFGAKRKANDENF